LFLEGSCDTDKKRNHISGKLLVFMSIKVNVKFTLEQAMKAQRGVDV
jgi:hypothetical protein